MARTGQAPSLHVYSSDVSKSFVRFVAVVADVAVVAIVAFVSSFNSVFL